jgi:hypothetical protein
LSPNQLVASLLPVLMKNTEAHEHRIVPGYSKASLSAPCTICLSQAPMMVVSPPITNYKHMKFDKAYTDSKAIAIKQLDDQEVGRYEHD